ncbi:kinase-like domain-containing protein [Hyaloraphidium curvatum]|nr:kinase-like domain-containing protein [Hyaloraphidium curvatum]
MISENDVVIDRTRKLGEGGFGVVYVGMLRGSMPVAVKTIKGDIDLKTMNAFLKEVMNWEGLVQRNVLPLMAFCASPPMMVMDLIEEGNLRQYLGRLAWDQAIGRKLLVDVANGMTYLHSLDILHGDLKSLNVLVDGSRAVITDFGLSRVRREVSKTTGETGGAGLQGTPGFVAPELLQGKALNTPADVYAFAMVCYEVLSKGGYPFDDVRNVAAIIYRVVFEQGRPDRPEGVPDRLWELVEECWRQDPAGRPAFREVRDRMASML